MSNDFWIGVYEDLKDELGREPTDEEMREVYKEKLAARIDYQKDMDEGNDAPTPNNQTPA